MEIGGYFELELRRAKEYHIGAIRLNTGRNALEYILKSKNYRKVYLPLYSCDVMLEPIIKLGLEYEFYSVDSSFYPDFDFLKVLVNEVLVYINYFGICTKQIKMVVEHCKHIIIDNSQAFFARPIIGVDTFYTPRKFFGVPDGAYLYTDKIIDIELEQDNSLERFGHLIGRIEKNAEDFYPLFKQNRSLLRNQPIKKMSNVTQKILQSIDYEYIKKIRLHNYKQLHKALSKKNTLQICLSNEDIPMVYPYLETKGGLRELLIQNKVYVAQYWPNVFNWCNNQMLEFYYARNILPLPIDQRYGVEDMKYLIDIINRHT
jgi:hypothetical protein